MKFKRTLERTLSNRFSSKQHKKLHGARNLDMVSKNEPAIDHATEVNKNFSGKTNMGMDMHDAMCHKKKRECHSLLEDTKSASMMSECQNFSINSVVNIPGNMSVSEKTQKSKSKDSIYKWKILKYSTKSRKGKFKGTKLGLEHRIFKGSLNGTTPLSDVLFNMEDIVKIRSKTGSKFTNKNNLKQLIKQSFGKISDDGEGCDFKPKAEVETCESESISLKNKAVIVDYNKDVKVEDQLPSEAAYSKLPDHTQSLELCGKGLPDSGRKTDPTVELCEMGLADYARKTNPANHRSSENINVDEMIAGKTELKKTNSLKRVSSLSKRTVIKETESHEEFENPWILQSESKKDHQSKENKHPLQKHQSSFEFSQNAVTKVDVNTTPKSVPKSPQKVLSPISVPQNCQLEMPFTLENTSNQNTKGQVAPVTHLPRSESIESVDSFSSFHSAHSVNELYFSDSEAVHNLDQEEKSSESRSKLESPKSSEFNSFSFSQVNETDDQQSENIVLRSNLTKSTSIEKQIIPYSLAEENDDRGIKCQGQNKSRIYSSSLDKLDNLDSGSPEKSAKNKKILLAKSTSIGLPVEVKTIKPPRDKHVRRSLDSRMAQFDIQKGFESHENRRSGLNSSTEFLSPVLEAEPKMVKTEQNKQGVRKNSLDETRFFTLPNPRRLRSKKKVSRLGSVSKMLSDKAQSLSNLKAGASFKLRKELEKSKSFVSSSATTFSDLMTKKASSFSTLIRRRTNSNTAMESPFKQYSKTSKKNKHENDFELVYEKILVKVPAKRPVTLKEQNARSKKLRVSLKLAKETSKSELDKFYDESDSGISFDISAHKLSDSGSLNSLRVPTLLDEMMRSVDTARIKQLCSVNDDDTESDCEESSGGSSLLLFLKQYSFDSDSKSLKDTTFLTVCRVCGKMKHPSESTSDSSDGLTPRRFSGTLRFAVSLCDLSSICQCVKSDKVRRKRLSGVFPHLDTSATNIDKSSNRKSWDIIPDSPVLRKNSKGGCGISGSVLKNQIPSYSMFDLRQRENETYSGNVDFGLGSRDSIDSVNVKPGALFRQKPVLDLSGENLDETADSGNGIIDTEDEDYSQTRSQSCGDLVETGPCIENEIRNKSLVKQKAKKDIDDDSDSYHSCSESVGTEKDMNDFENEETENSKSHSCTNLDTKEVFLGDALKLKDQRKKEMRKIKVKSMSSSHDVLSVLVPMDAINIDDIDGASLFETDKYKDRESDGLSQDNGQNIIDDVLNLVQKDQVNIGESQKAINSISNGGTGKENETNTTGNENKENLICKRCNSCKNVPYEIEQRTDNKSIDVNSEKIVRVTTKPPLPHKRNKSKVLSLSDISNQEICDSPTVNKAKISSMVDNGKEICHTCKCENDNQNFNNITKLRSKSCNNTPVLTTVPHSLKFTFDDKQVKKYIRNVNKFERQKSMSSEDISKTAKLSCVSETEHLYSAHSLNRLSKDSESDEVFNRLSFSKNLGPKLSSYGDIYESTPLRDYSRISDGHRVTSPDIVPQLPEFPSLDEECVYKYDVCLGYLLHSVQCDNQMICVYSLQRNKQLMESVITPLTPQIPGKKTPEHATKSKFQHKTRLDELPNPAAPITNVPSDRLAHAGLVLRTVLLARAPHMIRDRKFHLRTYRRCMVGTEMVDWLLSQSALVHSRTQAVGMWQALVEEGVVVHVCHEHQFKDKYLFYRFHEDDEGVSTVPTSATKRECEEDLPDVFLMLAHIGPDAMMRMILRKPPHERTSEDLEIIYEELLHIKALSHLSTMVKRELASVLLFESHAKAGTVLFNQGDEGKSWYIILKGSVNVVIYGKGVVCTLHEGDDFGKLALVNDAPRAATIVLHDDNCHFLRVDKDDFNRILRDVEANTVRLKEHGQDVLVLEKIPSNTQANDGTIHAHYKYSVMAGTPEKMLEHLLESRLDNRNETEIDGFLEDFLLTHVIFMPCNHLCPVLLSHYHSSTADTTEQEGFEFMLTHKKCVLHFVQEWATIVGVAFREDHTINAFLEELLSCVQDDIEDYPNLKDDLMVLEAILGSQSGSPSSKMKKRSSGTFTFSRKHSKECFQDSPKKRKPISASQETIFKVYCADHTYSTMKLPMDTKVEQLLASTKEKLGLGDDLLLCEVKSSGERLIFKDNDLGVITALSINGRLFVTPKEHVDALTPLPEQEGPSEGSFSTIEVFSSKEMAYHITQYDWELFTCVQEYELIYQVFGRFKFGKITANLDLFLRRFNEIQFWVVTEMVLTNNLSKRVSLLRKFIKLAAHCKEFRNLNSFFAIVMGLSNIAVSRLSQTWEKLPSKFKKMFADFETLMDPSRNHRVYRLSVAKMAPPLIPFMPLLMKDMTFTHEGNKTYFDGLVNFEKMHMISQTLKTVRFCRSAHLDLEAPTSLKSSDTSEYVRTLKVIDNQRLLTQLSHKLEPRKT